jgi:CO/xanthine dehydrogenase Mo-binding subunit
MTALDPLARGFRLLTDADAPGLLHGAVLRSPHPHAEIVSVDVSAARAIPGVVAVVTAADIPGKTQFGIRRLDQPFLCRDRVRMIGDPVAAVAADSPATARAALAALRVDFRRLPVVGSAAAALAAGAPELHPGGNLLHATAYRRGAVEAALAASDHVVSDVYTSGHQVHAFIEPEGAVVVPEAGGLTIFAPGHWAEIERREIAAMLALDPALVRVVASPVGGSFGGKDALHAQPIAALLAHVAGRPVRLIWRREESFAAGVKRHPFTTTITAGAMADGRLTALRVDMLADTGAYAQHGPEVLDTAHENAQGPYRWPAVELSGRLAYTNNGVAGAMRGFGAVQVQTALEQHIDRLAALCGLDPLSFRRRNLRADDAAGQLGQTLAAPAFAGRAAARLAPPGPPRREGRLLIGTGLAVIEKNEGFARGGPNRGAGVIALTPAGRIEVRIGLSDLGQGLVPAARAVAARLLGCAPEDVDVVAGDSASTPDAGPVAASRGAGVTWRALADAGPRFRAALVARAAERLGRPDLGLSIGSGGLFEDARRNAPSLSFAALAGEEIAVRGEAAPIETETGDGAVHALFTACAAAATVAVDTSTGRVTVRALRLVPVTGPVLVGSAVEAQMAGGALMAAGFVLTEHLPVADGAFGAANFDGYLAPTIRDAFDVSVEAVDDLPDDIVGPRGVGEIAVNAAAPAIANAVLAATGFVVRRLPVDAAALLAHLEARGW